MVGRLAAKISDVIFDQCIEWMTGSSKEQISAAMDRYTKKKKYEKYRISLDEEILKKFGDEAFYDELCNALLRTRDLDRLISRCMDRSVVDGETDGEFLRAILAQCNLGPGEMPRAGECIKYISDKTFEAFNRLRDAENIKLKNIIINQAEKTREEIRDLRRELSGTREKGGTLPEQEYTGCGSSRRPLYSVMRAMKRIYMNSCLFFWTDRSKRGRSTACVLHSPDRLKAWTKFCRSLCVRGAMTACLCFMLRCWCGCRRHISDGRGAQIENFSITAGSGIT